MSAHYPQPDNATHWRSEPDDVGYAPKPVLRSWLTESGLLTTRMRRLCAADFRLQVLEDNTAQHPDGNKDGLRRVILWCGDEPCVYAETMLPASATAAYPWLRQLGSDPLGEALQAHPEVSRGKFEFAQLTPAQLPADVPAATDAALWARRSAFAIGSATLTVTEVFLPGLTACENRRMHIAE